MPAALGIAQGFGVVSATAAEAVRELREQGWTRGGVGWGTFAADPLPPSGRPGDGRSTG
ncbi:hypothetical protein [Streptomyces sp. CC228A]|uniref:hypothetical protein n=1 Tax=Streptomyces sp. CC228A TaxID=2898186 RepID=UPI001F448DD8|nr:hypothetical protein [Streptomyces sp. CC228A]